MLSSHGYQLAVQIPKIQWGMYDLVVGGWRVPGEIPVFLACPDVDPMHSPKIGYSLCSQ